MIDADSLSVSFGDVAVLSEASLSVAEGEFVGLVGPNGAGKTTLLRAISAAISPDAGSVRVAGREVQNLSSRESSRLVSVVPQVTHLSFAFDVREVVEMGRTPYRSRFSSPTPEDRERVDRAMERTAVAEFEDRSIEAVSGGERQRVILARTLAQDTPVVLLDEPTASLDVAHQIETLELVAKLVEEGKTALAAIHDLELAARYCDRLAVLAGGGIVETGSPEEVLSADRLAEAFDATTAVATNPVTGSPTVTALPGGVPSELPERVHVLGRGAAAAGVLARLEGTGVEVTAGPLVAGGPAAAAATRQGIDPLVAEPYAPLDRELLAAAKERIRTADAVVVCDLHLGSGNQLLLSALDAPPAVVCETTPLTKRNYAGEEAAAAYRAIRAAAESTEPSSVLSALAAVESASRGRGRTNVSDIDGVGSHSEADGAGPDAE
ncbi:ATP-binding cassette domain-containing protein [Saliphagus infecundisoli]|uniref:Cobalamin import ATP-binding protein BtuD n=1 Tax=Saliphagus infecundisoli TaxID=1849069 RepID=A0ABD5QA26_9EURY|nr:ATP-binding cassette domain-containing protein [Saliphagus infecundisoli]